MAQRPRRKAGNLAKSSHEVDAEQQVVSGCEIVILGDFPEMGQSQQTQAQEDELELNSIQDLYRAFIIECPSGSLYLHEFKRMFGVHSGTPESDYMDNIFRAFDMNNVSMESLRQRSKSDKLEKDDSRWKNVSYGLM